MGLLDRINVVKQAKALLSPLDADTRQNVKAKYFGGQYENNIGDASIQPLVKAQRFNEVAIQPSNQGLRNLVTNMHTLPQQAREQVQSRMEIPTYEQPRVAGLVQKVSNLFQPRSIGSWQRPAEAAPMPTTSPSVAPTATQMPLVQPSPIPTTVPTAAQAAAPTQTPGFDIKRYNLRPDIVELLNMHSQEAGVPLDISTAILLSENGRFDPRAINRNANGTADYGLWQLNQQEIYDPLESTKRSAALLAGKRTRLQQILNQDDVPLGLLVEAYNKGADGAYHQADPTYKYSRDALMKVGRNPMDDPFLKDPQGYLRSRGL